MMRRRDTGQGTVTVIGLLVLSLAVAGLAIDTTRLVIVRRDLQNACDAGVLAGASQIDEGQLRRSGGTAFALNPNTARDRALAVINSQAPSGYRAEVRATDSEVAATVAAWVEMKFLLFAGVSGASVSASCRAQPHPPRGGA